MSTPFHEFAMLSSAFLFGGVTGLIILCASRLTHLRAPTVLCLLGLIPGLAAAMTFAALSESARDLRAAFLEGIFAAPLSFLPFFLRQNGYDAQMMRAARGLGGGRWHNFWLLVVPFYRKAVIVSVFLLFCILALCRFV